MIRILTASVLLAILAGTLWAPPIAFVVVLAIFLALAWHEYSGLAAEAGATPLGGFGGPLAIACAASFAAPRPGTPVVVIGIVLLVAAASSIAAGRGHPSLAVRRTIGTVGGICWLGVLPGFYVALRYQPQGVALIVLLFAAVSSGDIAAYYGGSTLGRHPLAPKLSPNKTIEGTLCGLAASAGGGAIVTQLWIEGAGWATGAAVGLLLGAVGQAGDLFESALKRAADTKDASGILPGHGGILDRLDGLLFAGAALYAVVFFGGL